MKYPSGLGLHIFIKVRQKLFLFIFFISLIGIKYPHTHTHAIYKRQNSFFKYLHVRGFVFCLYQNLVEQKQTPNVSALKWLDKNCIYGSYDYDPYMTSIIIALIGLTDIAFLIELTVLIQPQYGTSIISSIMNENSHACINIHTHT